jgi:hypothetical protein
MSKPSEMSFLSRALNPAPRGKFRASDREALAEVREDEVVLPGKDPVFAGWDRLRPAPRPLLHVERPHWSEGLGEPLDDEDLKAIPERLEVWVLLNRQSALRSTHRVGPKKLFDLKWSDFPSEYQLEVAKSETLKCAQKAALEALLEGATRVEIRSYRRKAASSRFEPGPVIHGLVGVLKSKDDILIEGEPSEAALQADSEYAG